MYPPFLADESRSRRCLIHYPVRGDVKAVWGEPAGAKTLIAALKRGAKALVFPGGAREVFKRGLAHVGVRPRTSPACVRIAAKFNATIIPSRAGGDEFFGNEAHALDTDDLLTMDNRSRAA